MAHAPYPTMHKPHPPKTTPHQHRKSSFSSKKCKAQIYIQMVDVPILILHPLLNPDFFPFPPSETAVLRFDIHYCVLWHTNLDEGHLWCHSAYRPLNFALSAKFLMGKFFPNILRRKLNYEKFWGVYSLRCSFLGVGGRFDWNANGEENTIPLNPLKKMTL